MHLLRLGQFALTAITLFFATQLSAFSSYPYRVYEPTTSQWKSLPQKWPLIIYLHGKGESGYNLTDLERHGPPYLIKNNQFPFKERHFFLATPQSPPNLGIWNPDSLESIRNEMLQKYPIDPNRISITGQSFGGIGVIYTLSRYPSSYQVGLALCGRALKEWVPPLINKPLWLIHGENDIIIPALGSRQLFKWLKEAGSTKVYYNELPGKGHMIHNEIYSKPEVWQWLLGEKSK